MKKKLVIFFVAALVVGGVWWLSGGEKKVSESELSNNTYGNGASGIELVEFGDFQCPSCGQFYPIVKAIKEQYKDTITFRFRHFPLQTIHPNARATHRAAQAAAAQGKFWEMHDALYENQTIWSNLPDVSAYLESLAQQLGLDIEKYKSDFTSSEVNSAINADVNLGGSLRISGTPTFILDGKVIENGSVSSVEKFSEVIDAAISEKAASTSPSPAQ